MNRKVFFLPFIALAFIVSSCFNEEDPGPLQSQEKDYSVLDFDRLEIGDALHVTVEQATLFGVNIRGDRRNIDDLEVRRVGNTLKINFREAKRPDYRQYSTYVTISMPVIHGATFSGAVASKISGFNGDEDIDLLLSGASKCQADVEAAQLKVGLSGASELNISGTASRLDAVVSGASEFRGFDLEVAHAMVDASGASKISVMATEQLKASASGASDIRYRGTPVVNVSSSGASSITQD